MVQIPREPFDQQTQSRPMTLIGVNKIIKKSDGGPFFVLVLVLGVAMCGLELQPKFPSVTIEPKDIWFKTSVGPIPWRACCFEPKSSSLWGGRREGCWIN